MKTIREFNLDPLRWEEMGQTEEGQYAQAEMIEFVIEEGEMLAWERHLQNEEYERAHRK